MYSKPFLRVADIEDSVLGPWIVCGELSPERQPFFYEPYFYVKETSFEFSVQ